ncbi:MAG TPA: histidine kinase [Syntrophomonadaceae bacterium]|nr:histidine kinase [Syntrophomonadaceae bacterium]
METEALDRVVKETFSAIEKGKEAIFDIAENARSELERVRKELVVTKQETLETIHQVDRYVQLEKEARIRLMEVSRDFHKYSEDTIREAYERAKDLQIQLFVLQEKEKNLRHRRDELERSLQRLSHTVEKAETLVTQIGVVLQFLQGTLKEITVKLDGLQQKQQVGLRIVQAQEEERRRIAREIHDGPAQSLANLVLRVELCEQLLNREPGRVKPELEKLKNSVRSTLQDIRKIIFDLRPMSLDDLGLVGGLRRFFGDFQERYGLPVEFLVFGQEKALEQMYSIALFRIIQEALNNIVKHARASRVVVKLELLPQQVIIAVKDDGMGFDPQSVEQDGGHYGLLNMRERARLLNGELQVKSAPGRGTEIYVMIPIEGEGDKVGGN